MALIIEQAANYFYPVQAGVYLDTTLMDGIFQVGEVVVPKQLVISAVIALVMTGAFVVFFVKTKTGMAHPGSVAGYLFIENCRHQCRKPLCIHDDDCAVAGHHWNADCRAGLVC